MLAPQFQAAAKFVAWGALVEVFRVMANVYSMMVYAEKDTKTLILPNAIGAITSLLMMFFLIPRLGIWGVGWALTIASFCVVVFLHIQLKIKLPIHIPSGRMSVAAIFGFFICIMSYYFELLFSSYQPIIEGLLQIGFLSGLFLLAEYYLLAELPFQDYPKQK